MGPSHLSDLVLWELIVRPRILRLSVQAELVSPLKEDDGREFRISIRELNNKITVLERQKRNSGHVRCHCDAYNLDKGNS